MDFLRNHRGERLAAALAILLGLVFAIFGSSVVSRPVPFAAPIDDLCRELLTESTVGRQALVGNLWFAPLPTLVHLVTRSPWYTLLLCHGAAAWILWRFLRRRFRPFLSLALYAAALGGLIWLGGSLPARLLLSWHIVGVVVLYTVLKLVDWTRSRGLKDWVLFSLALAAASLCGLRLLGWCAGIALLLPILVVTDKRSRPRLGGLLFLCYLPVLYALGSWFLMSRLIMGSALYPWRFLAAISFDPASTGLYPLIGGLLFAAALALYCIRRLRPVSVLAGTLALAFLWTGLLSGAGLKWATPVGCSSDTPQDGRPATADLFRTIGEDVRKVTTYGHVFVCSHAGLGRQDEIGGTAFTPCLDLYVDDLRASYPGQQLFLLVPRPVGAEATHSAAWRYDRLYENGAEHLLFFDDYGPWRLFQVVSAPLPSELEESEP